MFNCWISVKDELPKDNQSVLVTLKLVDETFVDIASFNKDMNRWEYDEGEEYLEYVAYWDSDEVIAWMPLPEPYKEVKDGSD